MALSKTTLTRVVSILVKRPLRFWARWIPVKKAYAAKLSGLTRQPLSLAERRAIVDTVKHRLGSSHQETYAVDYKQSVIEIYKQFIAFSIRKSDQTRALDIICRPWAAHVPCHDEWKYLKVQDAQTGGLVSKVNLHTRDELEKRVPLPTWMPPSSRAPFQMTNENRRASSPTSGPSSPGAGGGEFFDKGMTRVHADSLVGNPDFTHRTYSAAGTRAMNRTKLRFRKRELHYSMYVEGFVLDRVSRVHAVSQNGNLPRDWARAIGWQDFDQEPPTTTWDSFWRTLVADRGPNGSNPPPFYAISCKEAMRHTKEAETIDTHYLIHQGKCSIISSFLRRVQAVIWERKLLHTTGNPDDPRLGLASRDTEQGDLVCILYGCSVPVILRKKEVSASEIRANEEYDELHQLQRALNLMIHNRRKWKQRRKDEDEKRGRESLHGGQGTSSQSYIGLAAWYKTQKRRNKALSLRMRLWRAHVQRYWLIGFGLVALYTNDSLVATSCLLAVIMSSFLALVPYEVSDIPIYLWTSAAATPINGSTVARAPAQVEQNTTSAAANSTPAQNDPERNSSHIMTDEIGRLRHALATRPVDKPKSPASAEFSAEHILPSIELSLLCYHYSLDFRAILTSLGILLFSMMIDKRMVPDNVRSFLRGLWSCIRRYASRRSRPTKQAPEPSFYYELIGEAYIHGMMNGEAIKWQNETQTRPQLFELR